MTIQVQTILTTPREQLPEIKPRVPHLTDAPADKELAEEPSQAVTKINPGEYSNRPL